MSERDDRLPMLQMLEHAREALDMIRGQSRADLATNQTLQLALVSRGALDRDSILQQEFPVLIAALERALPGHLD